MKEEEEEGGGRARPGRAAGATLKSLHFVLEQRDVMEGSELEET